MRPPVLEAGMTFHVGHLGSSLAKVKKECTVRNFDHQSEKTTVVEAYSMSGSYITVPRHYGIQLVERLNLEWEDCTSYGDEGDYTFGIVNEPRDYQVTLINDIVEACHTNYTFKVKAHTGSGKTYCALQSISKLEVPAVVLVDQEFLKDQWMEAILEHTDIEEDEIGICQGRICNYENCTIVIAMVQSLYDADYGEGFYNHFGCVVFDELHTVGAEKFSRTLSQFPARYRFGLSATPNRRDSFDKLLLLHLGEIRAELSRQHRKSQLRYVRYGGVVSWYSNTSPKSGRYISELATDGHRCLTICKVVKALFEQDRRILVMSDRISHLYGLRDLCSYMGIPREAMGVCTGKYISWEWVKDPTPPRRPPCWERGTEYTPVKLSPVERRTPKHVLEKVKEESQVIFATYSIFSKGVDVPTLDAGVDATPRSQAEQVHGRILRSSEGKRIPVWVTIRDYNSYRAEHQFAKRISDYLKSNVEVMLWDLDKGLKRVDPTKLVRQARKRVQDLKPLKIVIDDAGNNIVLMPPTGRLSKSEKGRSTGKTTLRRKAAS